LFFLPLRWISAFSEFCTAPVLDGREAGPLRVVGEIDASKCNNSYPSLHLDAHGMTKHIIQKYLFY